MMCLLPPVNPMIFLSVLLYTGPSLILSRVIVTGVCLSDGDETELFTQPGDFICLSLAIDHRNVSANNLNGPDGGLV